MARPEDRLECPHCPNLRVWSKAQARFRCPSCDWTQEQRRARREQIRAAARRHRGRWSRRLV